MGGVMAIVMLAIAVSGGCRSDHAKTATKSGNTAPGAEMTAAHRQGRRAPIAHLRAR